MVQHKSQASGRDKIWIDLDNSPHVPFFVPIVEELEGRGYSVLLTARDCFQVSDLADLFHLSYKLVGHHYGKYRVLKLAGLCYRALQLLPTILSEKPDLALSHSSRSQLIVAAMLGIPSLAIGDYEHSKAWALIHPTWALVPEVIPDGAIRVDKDRLLKYPGIKEDVYAPRFKPDPSIKAQLGLNGEKVVVVVRPPADEAHYHNRESDVLFEAVIDFLQRQSNIRVVLLPRNLKQANSVQEKWPELFATRKIIMLDQVVDGLNLIWHSDLVISGGGTMNREAAALGVPVYSIFRGKLGAVDRYLSETGRLVLIESVDDIQERIALNRRLHPATPANGNRVTLDAIVDEIVAVMKSKERSQSYKQ